MTYRAFGFGLLALGFAASAAGQASQNSRFEIQRSVIAQQAGARIGMPAGGEGVTLSETGQVDREKLAKEIKKNGQPIQPGRIVTITKIDFGDKSIDVELDGGGKEKKSILDRIQVGVGGGPVSTRGGPQDRDPESATVKGSKITLRFTGKVPQNITPDDLRRLLDPVLDFTKHSVLSNPVDALPPEFKEAVLAKEARIGMDRNTVLLALGRPNNRHREPPNGPREDWIYNGRGLRTTFVTFENDVVVSIREY